MESHPGSVDPQEILANSAWMRALARRLVGDESGAEDVVQDTWLAWVRTPPRKAEGLVPWTGTFELTPGGVHELQVKLETGLRVTGLVRDALTGEPLSGISVRGRSRSRDAIENRVEIGGAFERSSKKDGTFEIVGLRAGEYSIYTWHPSYRAVERRMRFEVPRDDDAPIVIEMIPAGRLAGTITMPPASRSLQASLELVRTDEEQDRKPWGRVEWDGKYTVDAIPPGTYEVSLTRESLPPDLTIPPGGVIPPDKIIRITDSLGSIEIRAGKEATLDRAVE